MGWLNLLWMFLVISLTTWAIGNGAAMLFSALPRAQQVENERRRLWFLAALPWLLPVTAISALTASSVAKVMGWIHDHCLQHVQHHPHFCFEHLPEFALALSQSLPILIATLGFLTLLVIRFAGLAKEYDQVNLLHKLLPHNSQLKFFQDSRPLAFAIGIRRPTIYLSSGLKSFLSKREQRLVVAHEAAHIRNKDSLKNTVFELLLGAHWYRKALRQRWRLSTEVLADKCVTLRYDALDLAAVLLKLERAKIATPHPLSITGGDTQLRVQHLLHQGSRTDSLLLESFLCALLASVPLMAVINHHGIETVLGWWLS